MVRDTTRRRLLRSTGAAVAGLGVLGTAGSAAADDVDIPISSSGDGWSVHGTGEEYDTPRRRGALPEDLYAYSRKRMNVRDLHTVVWDGKVARDVRDDATRGSVNVTVARIPEVRIDNSIPVSGGTVNLDQRMLASEDGPALLIESEATLPAGGEYTVYTLANPEIGDVEGRPGVGDEAWKTRHEGYDAIVASDGGYYVAFAQRDAWRKQFDGQRIGVEGVQRGPNKSAWRDVYVEQDGWIDANEENRGRIDLAFGLYASDWDSVNWLTGVGFGRSEAQALGEATKVLENGYEEERNKHVPWLD